MGTLEARNKRQEGNYAFGDMLDVYDWVGTSYLYRRQYSLRSSSLKFACGCTVDISLLGDLAKEGWKVVFSEPFFKHMIETGAMESILMGVDEPEEDSVDWQGNILS